MVSTHLFKYTNTTRSRQKLGKLALDGKWQLCNFWSWFPFQLQFCVYVSLMPINITHLSLVHNTQKESIVY